MIYINNGSSGIVLTMSSDFCCFFFKFSLSIRNRIWVAFIGVSSLISSSVNSVNKSSVSWLPVRVKNGLSEEPSIQAWKLGAVTFLYEHNVFLLLCDMYLTVIGATLTACSFYDNFFNKKHSIPYMTAQHLVLMAELVIESR